MAWKAPLGGPRRVVADRQRQPHHRDVAARQRRPRAGQPSPPRAGRQRRVRGRACARGDAAAADNRTFFLVEAFNRADGKRLWEYRLEATGTLPGVHDKHNLASPSPVTDGQMVYAWFGTGPDRRARHERQAGLAAAPGDRDLAVRRDLGTQQLADAVRGHAAPAGRSRAGLVPARRRQAHGPRAVEGRPRQGQALLQHAARRRRRRPAPS